MHEFLYFLTFVSAAINILFAVEILLKMMAFTVSGFWQSRRNRIDLLITSLGGLWVALHFFLALPASVGGSALRGSMCKVWLLVGGETRLKKFTYTFGYLTVIMRFFTIAGTLNATHILPSPQTLGRNSTLKMLMLTVVMSMFRSSFIILAMALLVLFYVRMATRLTMANH